MYTVDQEYQSGAFQKMREVESRDVAFALAGRLAAEAAGAYVNTPDGSVYRVNRDGTIVLWYDGLAGWTEEGLSVTASFMGSTLDVRRNKTDDLETNV